MKIKTAYVLMLFTAALTGCPASTGNSALEKRMMAQAHETADAFVNSDFTTLANRSHPKIIEQLGNKEDFVNSLTKGVKEMNEKGSFFHSVKLGKPTAIVKAGSELHAIIPDTIAMKVPGGYLIQFSSLLATSPDNGNNWFFVDLASLDNENIKEVFPDFNDSLVIPVPQKPVFRSED